MKYTVACYYFPNYHPGDARNQKLKGRGWSEWDLVKAARPRFAGHQQPKVPLWGYADESDPAVMAGKIDAAADHGIGAFIFDWYYYDDGPFLERALDRGFLHAPNNHRLQFALMWANHDWVDIHPATIAHPPRLLYPGIVRPETFERLTDHIVVNYFQRPSYWKIDGKPYFSIYELFRLVESLGGMEKTRAALARFEQKVRQAGFLGLHLNAVVWGVKVLPGETTLDNPSMLRELGFSSVTSYVWVHHVRLDQFPRTPYSQAARRYFDFCDSAAAAYALPYHPNVTVGWDASPRTSRDDPFENLGYPFMATLSGSTPAAFREALRAARERLDRQAPTGARIVTINAWNEWTEGSYLEPDTVHGLQYLEAIREVFGGK